MARSSTWSPSPAKGRVGRLFASLLLLGGLALVCAALPSGPLGPGPDTACAHGGQFVPPAPPTPGGAVPLGTPRSNTPTAVTPGTGGPIVTPGAGFMSPGPVGRRKREFTPTYEVSWRLWWDLNRFAFLPPRPATLAGPVVTPAPEPGTPAAAHAEWEAARADVVTQKVIPFLRKRIDPASREDPDVVASACLALGKIASEPVDLELLLGRLLDERAPELVRESAALGLGLLRRSPAARTLDQKQIDPLRAKLLMTWDGYVDGERLDVHRRAREFAIFALGLLGDQPFHTDSRSKDGRLMSQLIWQRYTKGPYKYSSERVTLLVALRQQPPEGIPAAVLDEIAHAAKGEKVAGRKIQPPQQAHALAAYARLAEGKAFPLLLRRLGDPKSAPPVKLAAAIALEERAAKLRAPERLMAARLLERALAADHELLVMGIATIAMGRLLGADLAEGSDRLLQSTEVEDLLLARAGAGPYYVRGFGVLALALAARDGGAGGAGEAGGAGGAGGVGSSDAAQAWRARALARLRTTLRERTLEPELRAAAAVGLGLMGDGESQRDLLALARSGSADPMLRGYAALALGQIGQAVATARPGGGADPMRAAVKKALTEAILERGQEALQAHAAVGLSLLGESDLTGPLIEALKLGRGTTHLAGLARALGHLGDLEAVDALIAVAADRQRPELVRAMAVVALGRICDPEPIPSLSRLQRGAPYPVRTSALEEAFTIL